MSVTRNVFDDPCFCRVEPLIQQQLSILRCSQELTDKQIHNLRVTTKRLRGCLRLYVPVRDKATIRKVDALIKSVANAFSGVRDSHVQIKTLDKVLKRHPHVMVQAQPLYDFLGQGKSNDQMPDLEEVAYLLRQAMLLWQAELLCKKPKFIRSGLKYTYTRSRKLGDKAVRSREDDLYHQWRKWEKYWLYQLELMTEPADEKSRRYRTRLIELGTRLGKFHDYCVLESTVQQEKNLFEDERVAGFILRRIEKQKQHMKDDFELQYHDLFKASFKDCRKQVMGKIRA